MINKAMLNYCQRKKQMTSSQKLFTNIVKFNSTHVYQTDKLLVDNEVSKVCLLWKSLIGFLTFLTD